MTSPTHLHHFVSKLLLLSLVLTSAACSSEENYTDDPALNNDSQNSPIEIADSPAIITGVNSGMLTEDIDSDNDGLLTVNGKLNIADNNPEEAEFIPTVINGNFGRFALTRDGSWFYVAENNQSAIQNMNAGETITDSITVSSIDGTTQNLTITIHGADEINQPALITGVDSGNVTEDLDPDGDGLLAASGKLNITDNDQGEALFFVAVINGNYGRFSIIENGGWLYTADNTQLVIQKLNTGETLTDILTIKSIDGTTHNIVITIHGVNDINNPAVITGSDSGSVTEDVDPDGDNSLATSGKLNITDSDAGDAAFSATIINGNYGRFAITASGNWFYVADNTQSVIQNLNTGQSLTETLTISSVDGTKHNIVITINGADEVSTSADITISWTAPSEREDDTSISLSEINGYKVYYGLTKGQYTNTINVNDGSSTGHTIKSLPIDTYYIVVTTIDTDERESQHSSELTVSN